MPATVIGIEYDPNRSANIALIQYEDVEKTYILAPVGLKDGDKVKVELSPYDLTKGRITVSYTHLDVYKRQEEHIRRKEGKAGKK